MMSDLDPIYIIYAFIGISAMLFAEAMYLLFFRSTSYRQRVNRRLAMLNEGAAGGREDLLIALRRERGLTAAGTFQMPIVWINRLILQSGVTLGITRLLIVVALATIAAFGLTMVLRGHVGDAIAAATATGVLGPLIVLRFKRARRQRKFSSQFPDAIDIIVRSLRAGHPVPIAVSMVAREMPDPIGTEFGMVGDEITYGADLETAMRNLYYRVGQDDLPLFVTAVAIQGSTGGNLGEILENLSKVIRDRFKMRRKIKSLAAEGRASALILSSLPIGMFLIIQIVAPDFYRSVWHFDVTKIALGCAATWMGIGNFIMYRMVNFRI